MSFLTSAVRRTSLRLSLSLRAAFNLCYMCMKWVSKESLLFIIYYPMDGFAKYRGRERLKMWMRLDTRERLLTFFFLNFFWNWELSGCASQWKTKYTCRRFPCSLSEGRRFEGLRHYVTQRCEDVVEIHKEGYKVSWPVFSPSFIIITITHLHRLFLLISHPSFSNWTIPITNVSKRFEIVRTWSSPPLFTK